MRSVLRLALASVLASGFVTSAQAIIYSDQCQQYGGTYRCVPPSNPGFVGQFRQSIDVYNGCSVLSTIGSTAHNAHQNFMAGADGGATGAGVPAGWGVANHCTMYPPSPSGYFRRLFVQQTNCGAGTIATIMRTHAPLQERLCEGQNSTPIPTRNVGTIVRSPNTPAPNACTANPIHAGLGNKFQVESDYSGAGALMLQRYYNSMLSQPVHAFGNWRHTYQRDLSLEVQDTTVRATREDGKEIFFILVSGVWQPEADVNHKLEALLDAGGTGIGWKLITSGDEEERYDTDGRLISITSRTGQTQSLIYNAAGQLQSVTDHFGRVLSFGYDAAGRVISLLDPAGGAHSYEYDAYGNLVGVTYPDQTPGNTSDNPKRVYHYENPSFVNALTGLSDENAQRFATWGYDAQGRAILSEHAGGVNRYSLNFQAGGSTTVTDPLGTARTYNFQTVLGVQHVSNLSQPCASCGSSNASAASYDANGNATTVTDYNGNVNNYSYDLTRNLETSRTEAVGTAQQRSITTEWHPSYRLPTRVIEPNRTTDWAYDAQGNVLVNTVTDSTSGTARSTTYTYNAIGQVLTVDGPRTDVADITTYTYYPNDAGQGFKRGMLASVTNALGQSVQITDYDAHGRALAMIDANGLATSMSYDARGRLLARTVGTETTSFQYDGVGQLTRVTLPDGSFIQYSYDAAHRLTQIQDHLGNRIVYTLDNMGNRTREEVYFPDGSLAQTRSRTFDTLNRLAQEIGALNQTTTYSYDSQGNLKTVTDPLGRATSQSYDALNRMNKVTDALGGITLYDFDANDRIRQVTDPRGLATVYSYNGLDDMTQQVSPDTGATTNTYDTAGNLKTTQDARGETTSYSYDALNRVIAMSYGGTNVTFSYDQGANGIGRLTGMTDATGASSWQYDAQGRLITHTQQVGGSTTSIMRYGYNSLGQLTGMTYPSGKVLEYVYTNGQVTELKTGGTVVISNIQYQPFGPARSFTWGNGAGFSRIFDADGRLASHSLGASSKSLTYDAASRIQAISDSLNPAANTTYGYDELDRLTQAIGSGTRDYSYDPVGNRLTQSGVNSATHSIATNSNRLLAVTGSQAKSYSYDAAGNITADGTHSYSYDARGRLTSTTTPSGSLWHAINALGQRVAKSTPLADRVFHYAADGKLLAELNAQGLAEREYLYLGDQPIALWAQTAGVCSTDTLRVDTGTTFSAFDNLERLEVRSGRLNTADWEFGIGTNTQMSSQFVNGHLNWVNNKVYNWTLTYNGQGAATISVTDNGSPIPTKTWHQGMDVGNAVKFYVKSSANIGVGNKISVTIDTIQGQAALGQVQTASDNLFNEQALFYTIPAAGGSFAATGTVKMSFTGSYPPTGSRLNFTATLGNVTCEGAQIGPSNDLYYIHADHLNTPRSLTTVDASNKEVWRWDNDDPFGDNQANEDPDGDGKAIEFNLRFPGQYYDQESKTHYNYFRDYDPATGRYIQSDPIGLTGGLNTYGYVDGMPVMAVDPEGLEKLILFSRFDRKMYDAAQKDPDVVGTLSIYAHGDPMGVTDSRCERCISTRLDAKGLARVIGLSSSWRPGMPIWLNACNTGLGSESLGQRLADELNTRVYAPNQYVWYQPSKGLVGTYGLVRAPAPKPSAWQQFLGIQPQGAVQRNFLQPGYNLGFQPRTFTKK